MAAVSLLLFPAILLSFLLDLTSQDQQHSNLLVTQLHDSKLKIAKLESSLDEILSKIEARDSYLEDREKQIREMEERINYLQFTLSNLKSGSFEEKVDALEEEVRVLWATLRKNNFDLYVLQSKAQEAEDRLQAATLNVEKMQEIVSERWIQIQQFEQALQLREMAVLKAQRRLKRCSFLKFMDELSSKYLSKYIVPLELYIFERGSAFRSFMSRTLHHLDLLYSRLTGSHHQLQAFIKREMERHEFTAHLANEELVFVVASALLIFPVLSAWLFISSHLR